MLPDSGMLLNWEQQRQRANAPGSAVVDKFQPQNAAAVPTIWLSVKMANALFQGEKYDATTLLNRGVSGDPVAPFDLSATKKVTFTIAAQPETPSTQNVVAVWEGGDPDLKNEYVALGAHYDHIGDSTKGGDCRALNGDTICNGADDDGSGTTTLLARAEAISHAKQR